MKSISGYIFKGVLLLLISQAAFSQDTLRTYGPRIGIDLSRFFYYFTDPVRPGAECSLDFELVRNYYTVFEAGYCTLTDSVDQSRYTSGGPYARIGLDYNLLPLPDRSIHHSITAGFRYAASRFSHQAEHISIPSSYWGGFVLDHYEHTLFAHWIELTAGIKAEVLSNLFLGWSVSYRILLNPDMDPQIAPLLVPGYGRGTENREIGFSYSLLYKIPLVKR
jgi:hypothetical protein